jgi:tripartite ATP-independent transporter DctM subunit
MVVYAVAADVSIIQLFLAGFLPGLLVMLLYSGYIAGWATLNPGKQPPPEPALSLQEKIRESRNLLPITLLIVLIVVTLIFGWATATECAAFGVLGSLGIAAWSRSLDRKSFWDSVMGTVRMNAMIMLILAAAAFLSKAMAFTGIPRGLAEWVGAMHLSPFALIAVLTLMYIVLGMALDGISMIVLTTVVVMPLINQAGFDLIWFGIFMILVIEMAEISPPVGFNLFVLQTMSGRDSLFVARASLPFFFLLVIAVAAITVFPEIVTALPKWVFPTPA